MKKIFSYFMISMCLLGTSVVTSCGSDDDEPETLSKLPYEADAAVYEITNFDSDIAYIELTTAGNYFINHKSYAESKPLSMFVNDVEFPLAFTSNEPVTRAKKNNFWYGTYEKNSDGSYKLKDENATLKITSAGNGLYNLTLNDKTYEGKKLDKRATFARATDLCRSWRLKKVKVEVDATGIITTHISEEASNYTDLMNKLAKNPAIKFPTVEDIEYVSFSNTYMYVVKTNSSIYHKFWKWDNNKLYLNNNEIGYDVTFEGATMKFKNSKSDDSASMTVEYEFTETLVK